MLYTIYYVSFELTFNEQGKPRANNLLVIAEIKRIQSGDIITGKIIRHHSIVRSPLVRNVLHAGGPPQRSPRNLLGTPWGFTVDPSGIPWVSLGYRPDIPGDPKGAPQELPRMP